MVLRSRKVHVQSRKEGPVTLDMDLRQPVKPTIGPVESSQLWIRGLPAIESGQFAEPASREDSYLSECECPHDCLRDHANE